MASKSFALYGWFALWLVVVVIGWAYSYDFNRDVSIYEFGAWGWPRAILGIAFVVALIQFICGYIALKTEDSATDTPAQRWSSGIILRWIGFLGTPFVFAILLEPVGFYTMAPIFILTYLLLAGERRPAFLIGVTLGLYCVLLLVFVKLLYSNLPTGNISPFYDFGNWMVTAIRGNS